jgi:hypothetical protein
MHWTGFDVTGRSSEYQLEKLPNGINRCRAPKANAMRSLDRDCSVNGCTPAVTIWLIVADKKMASIPYLPFGAFQSYYSISKTTRAGPGKTRVILHNQYSRMFACRSRLQARQMTEKAPVRSNVGKFAGCFRA